MNAIRSVFTALGNLAASINGLAAIIDNAGNRLRQQMEYEPTVPALESPERLIVDPTRNGALETEQPPSATGQGPKRSKGKAS